MAAITQVFDDFQSVSDAQRPKSNPLEISLIALLSRPTFYSTTSRPLSKRGVLNLVVKCG